MSINGVSRYFKSITSLLKTEENLMANDDSLPIETEINRLMVRATKLQEEVFELDNNIKNLIISNFNCQKESRLREQQICGFCKEEGVPDDFDRCCYCKIQVIHVHCKRGYYWVCDRCNQKRLKGTLPNRFNYLEVAVHGGLTQFVSSDEMIAMERKRAKRS